MSLTAYLLESLLLAAIFRWWGLGWFGEVGNATAVLIALAAYAIVLTACHSLESEFSARATRVDLALVRLSSTPSTSERPIPTDDRRDDRSSAADFRPG